jgi:hypothetical protein
MTTDFLTSCGFLSDDQRAALRAQDLDSAAAFKHVTTADLRAEPFKLSIGKASQLLEAAGVGGTTPTTHIIQPAEPLDQATRIDRALFAAHNDPTKTGALIELGVLEVVLQADDKLDVMQTKAALAHAAAGAPLGATWQGQRIADVRKLSTPPIWCSPRGDHRPLQAGRDEISDVPWGELKLDGLRITAFGEGEGFFKGMTDEAVFAGMQPDQKLYQRVVARMKALEVPPESMDQHVIYSRSSTRATRVPLPPPPAAGPPHLTDEQILSAIAAARTKARPDGSIRVDVYQHNGHRVSPKRDDQNLARAIAFMQADGWTTSIDPRAGCIIGRAAPLTGGNFPSKFTAMLMGMFSPGELARFLRYNSATVDIVAELPAENPAAPFFAAAADQLINRGHVRTQEFWDSIHAERPRRTDEINGVMAALNR